ncbi:MAG: hypothetical protein IPO21_21235 [Bacteroidales bacterium]|nr:hypothetical protein [Bacteroidales bacterium]
MKHQIFIFLFTVFCFSVEAQEFLSSLRYDFIADNREYFNQYSTPQTIIGSRLDVQTGFKFDSVHRVMFGGSYLYEFGHRLDGHIPVLDLYYRYYDTKFDVLLGSFPRRNLLHYPLIMFADTVEYFRPNIQGAYISYNFKYGSQSVWLDWTGRQTATVREMFITGISGKLQYGVVYIKDHFHYWHRAGMANDSIRDIRDNNSFSILAGLDFAEKTKLDTLYFGVGFVTSSDKVRPAQPYTSVGLLSECSVFYKRIGCQVSYYYGEAPSIAFGDPIYSSKNYLRTNIVWIPFKHRFVHSKVVFGIHLVNGDIDYSQQILVSVNLNNK